LLKVLGEHEVLPTMKTEQARIGSAIDTAEDRLADLDAYFGEQQEILELAASLATRCGDAYRRANDRVRTLFNTAVFELLDVKGGRLCHEQYRPPFDGVFTVSEVEYGTRVEAKGLEPSNLLTASQALYQLSYAPEVVPHYQPSARGLPEPGGSRDGRCQ
jgi:hypothetical protein